MSAQAEVCTDLEEHSAADVTAFLKQSVVTLQPGARAGDIREDVPLVGDGLNLDSAALIELIMEIEAHFGFQFLESDLQTRTFGSLRSLVQVIVQRLQDPSTR